VDEGGLDVIANAFQEGEDCEFPIILLKLLDSRAAPDPIEEECGPCRRSSDSFLHRESKRFSLTGDVTRLLPRPFLS
jgi:hypothetical protein